MTEETTEAKEEKRDAGWFADTFIGGMRSVTDRLPELSEIVSAMIGFVESIAPRVDCLDDGRTQIYLDYLRARAEVMMELAKAGVETRAILRLFPKPSTEPAYLDKVLEMAPQFISQFLPLLFRNIALRRAGECECCDDTGPETVAGTILTIEIGPLTRARVVLDGNTMAEIVTLFIAAPAPPDIEMFLVDAYGFRLADGETFKEARDRGAPPVRIMYEPKKPEKAEVEHAEEETSGTDTAG